MVSASCHVCQHSSVVNTDRLPDSFPVPDVALKLRLGLWLEADQDHAQHQGALRGHVPGDRVERRALTPGAIDVVARKRPRPRGARPYVSSGAEIRLWSRAIVNGPQSIRCRATCN